MDAINKKKAAPAAKYVMKQHKRKGKPTVLAIHRREDNKQVGQLVTTAVQNADQKIDDLIQGLNNESLTEADMISCLNKLKGGEK